MMMSASAGKLTAGIVCKWGEASLFQDFGPITPRAAFFSARQEDSKPAELSRFLLSGRLRLAEFPTLR
jgi:hypothetical protein